MKRTKEAGLYYSIMGFFLILSAVVLIAGIFVLREREALHAVAVANGSSRILFPAVLDSVFGATLLVNGALIAVFSILGLCPHFWPTKSVFLSLNWFSVLGVNFSFLFAVFLATGASMDSSALYENPYFAITTGPVFFSFVALFFGLVLFLSTGNRTFWGVQMTLVGAYIFSCLMNDFAFYVLPDFPFTEDELVYPAIFISLLLLVGTLTVLTLCDIHNEPYPLDEGGQRLR
jgi:hypothetical protein